MLLGLASATLWAEQASSPFPNRRVPTASSLQAQDSETLLPKIPSQPEEPIRLNGISVDTMVAKVPSGTFHHDPDEYKSLYGYYGPFYNISNLNGQIAVLDQTVYTWPTTLWKASGMIRNQTRQSVHIKRVSATLRAAHNEVLGTATTLVPVSNLRPGEPAPFVIESTLPRSAISTVEWSVDFEIAEHKNRFLVFDIIDDRGSREGSLYNLFVTIRSEDAAATRRVGVVAAWLDNQDRVLYVDSPQVPPSGTSQAWRSRIDLTPNASADFTYSTKNLSVVSDLIKARRVLWGVVE